MTTWKDRSQEGVEVEPEASFHVSGIITVEATLLKVDRCMVCVHDLSGPRSLCNHTSFSQHLADGERD